MLAVFYRDLTDHGVILAAAPRRCGMTAPEHFDDA
jgi:hypothetical protein